MCTSFQKASFLRHYRDADLEENLAGRLTDALFTKHEKLSCNCRGVGKQRLDSKKIEAIRRVRFAKLPPMQKETNLTIEKSIREGIDEMCRRCVKKNRNDQSSI